VIRYLWEGEEGRVAGGLHKNSGYLRFVHFSDKKLYFSCFLSLNPWKFERFFVSLQHVTDLSRLMAGSPMQKIVNNPKSKKLKNYGNEKSFSEINHPARLCLRRSSGRMG
jgi:hypothetical protein